MVADLARDLANPFSPTHRDASELYSLLVSRDWLPTLSLFQVGELAQHADPGVVRTRLSLLEQFPRIAWIRNTDGTSEFSRPFHGSILDLIFSELEAWRPGKSVSDLCTPLRSTAFIVASDQRYLEEMVLETAASRRLLGSDQLARQVASVAHALLKDAPDWTVAQVRGKITKDPKVVGANFARRIAAVEDRLRREAAPGTTDVDLLLRREVAVMAADARAVLSASSDPLDAYLAQSGLRATDVVDTDTMRDVGDLVRLRSVLQIILKRSSPRVSSATLMQLRPKMLPSHFVDCIVRRKQIAQGREPRGSDLTDASIAAMALYADLTIVDKRTQELLRQIRREQPDLHQALGRTVPWSTPSRVLRVLGDR